MNFYIGNSINEINKQDTNVEVSDGLIEGCGVRRRLSNVDKFNGDFPNGDIKRFGNDFYRRLRTNCFKRDLQGMQI